jgi:hypothetical protein
MERLTAKIASLDAEVARPDIPPHEVRQRLKERAKFVAEKEAAEAVWLEASEAYEAAVRERAACAFNPPQSSCPKSWRRGMGRDMPS